MAALHKQPLAPKFAPKLSRVTAEGPGAIRKWGAAFKLNREVEAMEYVRLRTSIPISTVLSMDIEPEPTHKGGSSILMEMLPGDQLGIAWPNMSDQAQSETTQQLRMYLKQLRELRPEGTGWIGSCSNGPAYDHRLDNRSACGPFASVGEFHDYLVAPVKECPKPELAAKYRQQLPDTHDIHFAHADLSAENILVDPVTGNVTGILDWEMAGFWPAWWEYRKALFGGRDQPWWTELVKETVPEYFSERVVDMDLEWF